MSRNRNDDRPKREPTGDYPVGYCRTPDKTKYKSGQPSANPKGRPRGRKNDATIFREILEHKVEMTLPGGKKSKMTILHAAAWKQVAKAAAGDSRAWTEVKALAEQLGLLASEPTPAADDEFTPGEEASLDDFFARYAEGKGLDLTKLQDAQPEEPEIAVPIPTPPILRPTVRTIFFPPRAVSEVDGIRQGRAR